MKPQDDYHLTTMLDEARIKLNRQFTSIAVFRDHAKTVFGASSIIVSLFSTLKIDNNPQDKIGIYVVLWLLIAICYLVLTFMGIKAIFPKEIFGATEATWENYKETYFGKTKEDVLLQQISNYLDVIGENQKVVIDQEKWSKKISIIFPVLVILIVILGFVQIL